jgi:hypothetical protein
VVSLRAYLLSADNNDERFFIVWFCAFPVRFFEKSIGFSLAENHRLRLTQRCTFLVEGQPRKKKQTSAELKRRLESTTFATLNRMFFFSVLSPSFFRPFLSSALRVNKLQSV